MGEGTEELEAMEELKNQRWWKRSLLEEKELVAGTVQFFGGNSLRLPQLANF